MDREKLEYCVKNDNGAFVEWLYSRVRYLERKVAILHMEPSDRRDSLLYNHQRFHRKRKRYAYIDLGKIERKERELKEREGGNGN